MKNTALLLILTPILLITYGILNVQYSFFTPISVLDLGLWGAYNVLPSHWEMIGAGIVVLSTAFFINYTFNHYGFHQKNTYLPAFVYVVWMSFFEQSYHLNGLLLSHFFLIFAFFLLLSVDQRTDARKTVFNIAVLSGLATSLFLSQIVVFPFLYAMLWSLRLLGKRDAFLCAVGFVLPSLYAIVLRLSLQTWNFPYVIWNIKSDWWMQQSDMFILFALTICFVFLSLFGLRRRLSTSTVRFRNMMRVVLLFFVAMIAVGSFHFWWNEQITGFTSFIIGIALISCFGYNTLRLSYFFWACLLMVVFWSVFRFLF